MSDKPADPSREEGAKAFAEIFYWLVRLTVVGLIAYYGWYEPVIVTAFLALIGPPYLMITWIGIQAFALTVTTLYIVFIASGEVRRRRARRLLTPAQPFTPRPLSAMISAIGQFRRPVRSTLFWLILPLSVVFQLALLIIAFMLFLVLIIAVPLGVGFAVDFLLSPWIEGRFAPVWLVIAAAFAVVIPRRARRPLLDHPWLWGRMVFRRIRTTWDRLFAALSAR